MKNIFEFNEYKYHTVITDDELLEMANISSKKTGLTNIYIWIGPNPHFHGYRIKVSNIPDKFSKDDCFTITIPKLKIIGNVNRSFIDDKKIKNIFKFIKLNEEIIKQYSDENISTDELIDGLKPINNEE